MHWPCNSSSDYWDTVIFLSLSLSLFTYLLLVVVVVTFWTQRVTLETGDPFRHLIRVMSRQKVKKKKNAIKEKKHKNKKDKKGKQGQ